MSGADRVNKAEKHWRDTSATQRDAAYASLRKTIPWSAWRKPSLR
jgi:hypothetical protein